MQQRGQKTALTFSNDVRKIVRKYVIIPVLLSYFLILAIIVLFYGFSISYSAKAECRSAAQRFESIVSSYEKRLDTIVNDHSLEKLIAGQIYGNAFSERVYNFINEQDISAHFFLLDASGSLVLGSSTILSSYLLMTPPYNTGFMARLQNNPSAPSKMLSQIGNARTSSMVLSIGQAIVRDEEIIGYFVFELSPSQILEYISTGEMGDVVVTNSFFTTLVTSKNEYIDQYSKLKTQYRGKTGLVVTDAQKCFIASEFLESMDSWVFIIVKAGTLSKAILITSLASGVVLLISVCAISGVSGRVLYEETSSIDALISSIKSMKENGLYSPLVPVGSKFRSLEASYSELLQDIRDLAQSNRLEASMRERAEIKQLESQFNPHFIFNTLEIIRCYIKVDPVAANRMILDFSNLLRYSIDESAQIVPLKDDLHYVESYLSMNKMSSPNAFSYSIDVSKEALDVPVPKLCIQPLVENAIKYAKPVVSCCECRLSAYVKDGYLHVTVKDNGIGIEKTKLDDIMRVLECPETPSKYFGLYNVHRRLKLLYGESSGISITSNFEKNSAKCNDNPNCNPNVDINGVKDITIDDNTGEDAFGTCVSVVFPINSSAVYLTSSRISVSSLSPDSFSSDYLSSEESKNSSLGGLFL